MQLATAKPSPQIVQVLDRRIDQHIAGIARDIEWTFGRKRGLGL
jgi:hypothetical protein